MKHLPLALCAIALGLLCGCKQDKPTPAPPADVSDGALVRYFSQQIEAEHPQQAPQAFYSEYSSPESYPAQQQELWKLWHRANSTRLTPDLWGIDTHNPLIWELPQGEKMQYRLLAKGTMPEGGYPFFINLHGGGSYSYVERPWDSEINEEEWHTLMSFTNDYKNTPALYFVPRMADDRKGRWHYLPQRVAFRRAYQVAVLKGEADPDRVYLTGISEGGYGAFRLGLYMPDYFAAVGSLAAAIESLELAENLRNVAFRFDVGERDHTYNRSLNAMDWRDKLDKLTKENPEDFVHQSNIIPEKGHTIPYLTITSWLAKYKRRVYPKHLSYTYYNIDYNIDDNIDDGFSDGVYYVGFGKLSQSRDARLHIDVRHESNNFEVETKLLHGSVKGKLTLFIDEVDFTKPVVVRHNGQVIFSGILRPSKGVMAEAIALFGDPKRIFPAKVNIPL